jgi:methionyl aminopeptidase
MINTGKKETIQMRDGWTIKTADGMPSAHFEYAVAVDKGKAEVLTTFEFIEKVLNNN